jgi:hypothetical protein
MTTKGEDFPYPSKYDVIVKARNAQGRRYTIVHFAYKAILDTGYEGIVDN